MPQLQPNRRSNIKRRPKDADKAKVIFHNDDVTTFDFVILVLVEVFFKSAQEAADLAMLVHVQGQAPVGIYAKDIAVSKAELATEMARANNFPLRITTENA